MNDMLCLVTCNINVGLRRRMLLHPTTLLFLLLLQPLFLPSSAQALTEAKYRKQDEDSNAEWPTAHLPWEMLQSV